MWLLSPADTAGFIIFRNQSGVVLKKDHIKDNMGKTAKESKLILQTLYSIGKYLEDFKKIAFILTYFFLSEDWPEKLQH